MELSSVSLNVYSLDLIKSFDLVSKTYLFGSIQKRKRTIPRELFQIILDICFGSYHLLLLTIPMKLCKMIVNSIRSYTQCIICIQECTLNSNTLANMNTYMRYNVLDIHKQCSRRTYRTRGWWQYHHNYSEISECGSE